MYQLATRVPYEALARHILNSLASRRGRYTTSFANCRVECAEIVTPAMWDEAVQEVVLASTLPWLRPTHIPGAAPWDPPIAVD